MSIPIEILQKLKIWAEANGLAMLSAGLPEQGIHAIMIAPKDMTPEFASCLGAELLLHGITSGMISESNDRGLEERKQTSAKPN